MNKNEYFFSHLQLTDLNIYNVGRSSCDPGWAWGPAVRNHYLLVFLIAGKGSFTADRRKQSLSAGDLFLLMPHKRISYAADMNDPWEYIWVAFQGTLANKLFFDPEGKTSVLWGSVKSVDRQNSNTSDGFFSSMKSIVEEASLGSFQGEVRALGCLIALFPRVSSVLTGGNKLLMKKNGELKTGEGLSRNTYYVSLAKEFIFRNFSQNISILSIAKHIGLDRSYFSTVFKRESGISPGDYLVRYRMNQAWIILEMDMLSIETVSNSVGFLDSASFSRAFRRIYGISPSLVVYYSRNTTKRKELDEIRFKNTHIAL